MRRRFSEWWYWNAMTLACCIIGGLILWFGGIILLLAFAPRMSPNEYYAACLKHGFTQLQCEYLDTKK